MENTTISNLLKEISVINKKNKQIFELSGGRFNVFGLCKVDHYENIHSDIIAELLNPKGSHGLKEQFLKLFIDEINFDEAKLDFDLSTATVAREAYTGNGRIDILIKDENRNAIIIESKVDSGDGKGQLKKYNDYAKIKYDKYIIVYLTLDGRDASQESVGDETLVYIPISFRETIINWLDKCVNIAALYPMLRETLIQYINFIKILTGQDLDTNNKNEIQKLLLRDRNTIDASIKIGEYFHQTLDSIVRAKFNTEMIKYAKENKLEFDYRGIVGTQFKRFQFFISEKSWKNYRILFNDETKWEADENLSFCYGIHLINPKDITEEQRIKGFEIAKDIDNNNEAVMRNGWIYKAPMKFDIDTWKSDIYDSDNFFNDCVEKIKIMVKAIDEIEQKIPFNKQSKVNDKAYKCNYDNCINEDIFDAVTQDTDSFITAAYIADNYTTLLEEIIQTYFNPKMEKYARDNDMLYFYCGIKGKKLKRIKFVLKINDRLDSTTAILFNDETPWEKDEKNAFCCGIYTEVKKNYSKEDIDTIVQVFEAVDNNKDIKKAYWYYKAPMPFTIDTWINDIYNSDKFFKACVERIENLLRAVEELKEKYGIELK